MTELVLHGPAYSAYTRTAILTLIEKGVPYHLDEVDFRRGMPEAQRARHPFAKVPALEHGAYLLYETQAICRYVDAAFDGPPLQPTAPQDLGRMAQIIGILDSYLSQPIRMGLTNQLIYRPLFGLDTDEAMVAEAEAAVANGLPALEACMTGTANMVGNRASLADLHAVPLIDYLLMCPRGEAYLAATPRLAEWWQHWRERPSVQQTRPVPGNLRQ